MAIHIESKFGKMRNHSANPPKTNILISKAGNICNTHTHNTYMPQFTSAEKGGNAAISNLKLIKRQ